jgi:FAD/FMN-containing dehydrogenase
MLIEVNHALELYGRLLITLAPVVEDYEYDLRGAIAHLRHYGFELVEWQGDEMICFRKFKQFDPKDLLSVDH